MNLIFQCENRSHNWYIVSEVLTAVTLQSTAFWVVTLCSSEVAWRFGGTYRLHLRVWRASQERNKPAAAIFTVGLPLDLEEGAYVALGNVELSEVHGVTTQKALLFINIIIGRREFSCHHKMAGPQASEGAFTHLHADDICGYSE
jgi:hypothetical protein